jgi:ADP-heptose:LPS heptosyltransferase
MVVGEKAYGLLAGNPQLHSVFEYRKGRPVREMFRFLMALKKERFDYAIDVRNSIIPYVIGVPSHALRLAAHVRHVANRYERIACMCRDLGLSPSAPSDFALFSNEDESRALRLLRTKGIFSLNTTLIAGPGARLPLKRWPAAYFADTVRQLSTTYGLTGILVGDESEMPVCEKVASLLNGSECVNLCGKLSQKELAVLVSHARLVLANDSALAHFAHYYRRPAVVMFGPTNPAKYAAPFPSSRIAQVAHMCRACEESLCPHGRDCFESLKPEQIIHIAHELLAQS